MADQAQGMAGSVRTLPLPRGGNAVRVASRLHGFDEFDPDGGKRI